MLKTRKPLTVELGPGLIGGIFDGIQRPVESLNQFTETTYIPHMKPALDKKKLWPFRPTLKVNQLKIY